MTDEADALKIAMTVVADTVMACAQKDRQIAELEAEVERLRSAIRVLSAESLRVLTLVAELQATTLKNPEPAQNTPTELSSVRPRHHDHPAAATTDDPTRPNSVADIP
jgi:hypothetical protein